MKVSLTIKLLFLFVIYSANAQNSFYNFNLEKTFLEYTKKPREISFAHINKSTFIKGEYLGFTAYNLIKETKSYSNITFNLYCAILDKNEKVIKKKLFKVKNGITNGLFKIDSLFTSGNYKFIAYTNWMKNFNEQIFFVQTIKVIDPEVDLVIRKKAIKSKIDAQFLPESGHMVLNIHNRIGVVLKDVLGFGTPDLKGDLIDFHNQVITSFKVNELGIGRFSFTPKEHKDYKVRIRYNDESFIFKLPKAEEKGVTLSLDYKDVGVLVSLKTNEKTITSIKNKIFKLTLHDGKNIKSFDLSFKDKLEINQFINPKYLNKGLNIFTIFNDKKQPILERLYFNYNGIKIFKSNKVTAINTIDSILVKVNYKEINPQLFNNISVSVLPLETKSYEHHHNLLSYIYLRPYVKGTIEKAKYYFTNINKNKKLALDNLLITQGWSSYDWNKIFNYKPETEFFIEDGISVDANVVNKKESSYVFNKLTEGKRNFFVLKKGESKMSAFGLYPNKDEKLEISKLNSKGKLIPAKAYVQFYPAVFPELDLKYDVLNLKANTILITKTNKNQLYTSSSLNDVQNLDEIIVKGKRSKDVKIEKIKLKTIVSGLHVFTDDERKQAINIADYLRAKGFIIEDRPIIGKSSEVRISRHTSNSVNLASAPIFYLNGMPIDDLGQILQIDMTIVKYIHVNRHGLGYGSRGGSGGVIEIFTDSKLGKRKNRDRTFSEYKFPLTFSSPKKYYAPKYQNYDNSFFKNYGIIDWLPINKINKFGDFNLKIENNNVKNMVLFIQGITENGGFISETIKIKQTK